MNEENSAPGKWVRQGKKGRMWVSDEAPAVEAVPVPAKVAKKRKPKAKRKAQA